MKTYKVCVNGTEYEVTVEEMKEGEVSSAKSAPKAEAAPAPAAASVAAGEGETIAAPMPGTILAVNINVGDAVKKGQVLFILEAMKMENEIMAPHDGTVTAIGTTKGSSVNSGDLLCTLQ